MKLAAVRWREGDEGVAAVHLALSRLGRLRNPTEAARRLFMADGLMRAGVDAGAILDAIGAVGAKAAGATHDVSHERRILPGNGRASGEWTDGGGETAQAAAVRISGSGDVRLLTHPAHLNTQISGSGSVNQTDAR